MDLDKIIRGLKDDKAKLEQSIAELERLSQSNVVFEALQKRKRGRKSMGVEERKEVSERMRQYWAERRNRQSK